MLILLHMLYKDGPHDNTVTLSHPAHLMAPCNKCSLRSYEYTTCPQPTRYDHAGALPLCAPSVRRRPTWDICMDQAVVKCGQRMSALLKARPARSATPGARAWLVSKKKIRDDPGANVQVKCPALHMSECSYMLLA